MPCCCRGARTSTRRPIRSPRATLAATCRAAVLRRVGHRSVAPRGCAGRRLSLAALITHWARGAGGCGRPRRARRPPADSTTAPDSGAVRRRIPRGAVSADSACDSPLSPTGGGRGSREWRFVRAPIRQTAPCAARLATATDQSNGPPLAQPRLAAMRRLAVGGDAPVRRGVMSWHGAAAGRPVADPAGGALRKLRPRARLGPRAHPAQLVRHRSALTPRVGTGRAGRTAAHRRLLALPRRGMSVHEELAHANVTGMRRGPAWSVFVCLCVCAGAHRREGGCQL